MSEKDELPYVLVKAPDGDRQAWLDIRKKGVGGSDVSAILGMNPWKSAYQLWAEKSGLVEEPDISDRPNVMWGNLLEGAVGGHFADMHPEYEVKRLDAVCRNKERPWAQASLDFELIGDEGMGVLEIKTTDARNARSWEDGVPDYYVAQVTHYLSVTGRGYAWVAVLIGGNDYREFRIDRDKDDVALVDGAVDAFWRLVEDGTPPEITDGGAGTSRAVLNRHMDDDGSMIECEAKPADLAMYQYYKAEERAAADKAQTYAAKLKEAIGDGKGISYPGGRVTWVRSRSRKLDSKRFKKEMPDVYERYSAPFERDGGLRIKEWEE